MIYTAVFQNSESAFIFETHVSSHDRNLAWHDIHEKRKDENSCLVLLIDGQANVRTYDGTLDDAQ